MRRGGAFLAIFALLQWLWGEARGTALERLIINDLTVGCAVAIANFLTPAVQAVADGSRIRASGGGINILNGCEGIEIVFLLVAALCVFPASWRQRFLGIATGTAFVFALNQLRILMLFYAYRADKALFGLLHGTVAPVAMIACSVVFLLLWAKVGAGGTATHAPAGA
jgi:exosortase family protein XrtM